MGDMLAWIHQATASENEFLKSMFRKFKNVEGKFDLNEIDHLCLFVIYFFNLFKMFFNFNENRGRNNHQVVTWSDH